MNKENRLYVSSFVFALIGLTIACALNMVISRIIGTLCVAYGIVIILCKVLYKKNIEFWLKVHDRKELCSCNDRTLITEYPDVHIIVKELCNATVPCMMIWGAVMASGILTMLIQKLISNLQ